MYQLRPEASFADVLTESVQRVVAASPDRVPVSGDSAGLAAYLEHAARSGGTVVLVGPGTQVR